jgi:hypothetical protein
MRILLLLLLVSFSSDSVKYEPVYLRNKSKQALLVEVRPARIADKEKMVKTTFIESKYNTDFFTMEHGGELQIGYFYGRHWDNLNISYLKLQIHDRAFVAGTKKEIFEQFNKNWLGKHKKPYEIRVRP